MSEEEKNAAKKKEGQTPKTDDEQNKKIKKEEQGPNANWKDDENLDENGNPKEGAVKKKKEKEPIKKEEEEEKEKNKGAFDKSAAQQVEGFLEDAGLKPSEVAKAVSENDGITPEILKALVDKHGESVANLIADKIQNLHTSSMAAVKERDNALYDQVDEAFGDPQGGQETFKELAAWAKTNIENSDRVAINAMLAKGGLQAKLAMQELITTFKESDDYTQAASLEVADNVSDLSSGQALDKRGYDREMRKLRKANHVYGESKEMEALDRRRMKEIKRGR